MLKYPIGRLATGYIYLILGTILRIFLIFSQESPQSNAIHIGHNNPVGSDIKIKQTKPYNTSVHISLNVGSGSKVRWMARVESWLEENYISR